MAARAVGAATPGVTFQVIHQGEMDESDQLQLPLNVDEEQDVDLRGSQETLVFRVSDTAFQVTTRSPDDLDTIPPGITFGPSVPIASAGSGKEGSTTPSGTSIVYSGSAGLNPNFLYDTARSIEVLLTLAPGSWTPDYGDTLMLATAVEAFASAAAEHAGAPILFLQSPVSPFKDPPGRYRYDGSGEEPRISHALALRMAVGLEEGSTVERLRLIEEVTGFADRFGMGLQVADRRLGRGRGEWWTIFPVDRPAYERTKGKLYPWAPQEKPAFARMLTFVGPARVGSSLAIARDLIGRNVGILAVAVSALQDIAFVNLLCPIAPPRQDSRKTTREHFGLVEGLGRIASECGLTPQQSVRKRAKSELTAALDYGVLSTGPVGLRWDSHEPRKERPLWVSWDMASSRLGEHDVMQVLLEKLSSSSPHVSQRGIDYYRSRVLPTGRVRGRAKISVLVAENVPVSHVPGLLGEVCAKVELEVASKLKEQGVPLGEFRFRVAWRERWLGRWTPVL
jgi:hypothetical protein